MTNQETGLTKLVITQVLEIFALNLAVFISTKFFGFSLESLVCLALYDSIYIWFAIILLKELFFPSEKEKEQIEDSHT